MAQLLSIEFKVFSSAGFGIACFICLKVEVCIGKYKGIWLLWFGEEEREPILEMSK